MASGGFGGGMPHLFPSLGPAILISMTYIDLGKWVAVVEGGYLSAGIGMVTRKNLAEICSGEYTRLPCILLGALAELSMIISDITMVLGIAHGFNLLFGMDLLSCIIFAILGTILVQVLLLLLGNVKATTFYARIAGFALLFYVLGVLISQPEVPVITNEFFPRLTGENAYSIMALLGANIMSHNFYIHSSIVQSTGDPDVISHVQGREELNHLQNWSDQENLQLLNLVYALRCDSLRLCINDRDRAWNDSADQRPRHLPRIWKRSIVILLMVLSSFLHSLLRHLLTDLGRGF